MHMGLSNNRAPSAGIIKDNTATNMSITACSGIKRQNDVLLVAVQFVVIFSEKFSMEQTQSKFGAIGIVLGGIALLLALLHFWAGPFSPQPTIETVVAEKVASIRSAALDALKGKEPVKETFIAKWSADKITEVVTACLGGLALILAAVSFANKEPGRIAGGAAALGVSAIAFQFIAMYAMALLVVLLICAVLSSIGIG